MAINPENVDTVTVPQLDTVALALTNLFAHSAPNGKLGKSTIQSLVDFMAPYVADVATSGFRGSVDPSDSPIDLTGNGFYIGSKGVYPNFGGVEITEMAGIISQVGSSFGVTQLEVDTSKNQLAFLSGSGFANINTGTGKVNVTGQMFIAIGSDYLDVEVGEGTFNTVGGSISGLNYIFYNKLSRKINVYNYTAVVGLNSSENVLLGVNDSFIKGTLVSASMNKILMDGTLDFKQSYNISFSDQLEFDNTTSTIKLKGFAVSNIGGGAATKQESDYATGGNPNPFTLSLPSGNTILFNRKLFDQNLFPFEIKTFDQVSNLDVNSIVIAISYNGFATSYFNIRNTKKDGYGLIEKSLSFLVGTEYTININSSTKKLKPTGGNGGILIVSANGFSFIDQSETNRIDDDGPLFYLLVKKSDNKIYYSGFNNISNYDLKDWYFIGSFWAYDPYSFQGNAKLLIDGVGKNESDYVATGELLLPSNMYFVNDRKLPLYEDSIKRNKSELNSKTALVLKDNGDPMNYNLPYYEFFDIIRLDPSKLQGKLNIATLTRDRSKYFISEVNVIKKDGNLLNGRIIKSSAIGDSLTNRGVSIKTNRYLIPYGIQYDGYGTIINADADGGHFGEGREGWTFSNFIGRDNIHDFTGTVITRMPIPANNNMNQNPFLKIADAADKADHPDWCFRNTGAQDELSYATDPVKTGNFYIFDYTYYIQSYGIPTDLDVVTIALSTNDYTLNGADALNRCKQGLTVMLTQIKKALPNVKIGVIPAPSQGVSKEGDIRFNLVADWINAAQKIVTDMQNFNINIIGVWAHMSRYFNDPATISPLKSDGNTTNVATSTDFIHFDNNGYKEYVPALGNWVINVV